MAEMKATNLYNKLLSTELLRDNNNNKPLHVLDALARSRSQGISRCTSSKLSLAGRELISKEKMSSNDYPDRSINVLTARGIMVSCQCEGGA